MPHTNDPLISLTKKVLRELGGNFDLRGRLHFLDPVRRVGVPDPEAVVHQNSVPGSERSFSVVVLGVWPAEGPVGVVEADATVL